jgi:hypothetical protein
MTGKRLGAGLCLVLLLAGCGQRVEDEGADRVGTPVPEALPMGGERSVMSFFITSVGSGRGGDLGGLAGADAHCQMLAAAEGAGDREWRAYLSASATDTAPAVHARDRIGRGPWYNAEGLLIAADLDELHGDVPRLTKDTAVTQRLDLVNGVGDDPNEHDILTGSRPDGTAFDAADDLTCRNWTSSSEGRAQVGHHDRVGRNPGVNSWNSVHASSGCSQEDLVATGGSGRFYCFAID